MNRFYIKQDGLGTNAAAIIPELDQVIQVFIGSDGSRTIQLHSFEGNGVAIIEKGLSSYEQVQLDAFKQKYQAAAASLSLALLML